MTTQPLSRRSLIGTGLAGLGWAALTDATEQRDKEAPHQGERAAQNHQAGDLPGQAALAVPQGPHQRRDRRPGRADRRGPGADRRRRRSRRSSRTSSARTRARSSTTGRRSTATPSTAAARSSPAPSAASTWPSGTSRARRWACRSTSCSAARPATGSASTPTPARRSRSRRSIAQGFTAFKTRPAKRRPARYVETPAEVRYAAEKFAELRKAVGDDVDIAIDFHGAISPAHGQAAHQGAGAATSRCSSRSRATARTTTSWPRSPAAPTCRSPPASASSPSGASARCWRSGPRRSSSPTSATPAGSPRSA